MSGGALPNALATVITGRNLILAVANPPMRSPDQTRIANCAFVVHPWEMIESMPLQTQNALLRGLIQTAPYGILVLDQQNRVKCWSALAETIFETPACDTLERPIDELLVVDLDFSDRSGGAFRLADTQTKRDCNSAIEIEQFVHPIKIDSQDWTIIYISDVTLRRQREQRLTSEAVTDPLSGLLNRRGFQRKLESVLPDKITLAIVDTDNFKRINDRFGHQTGDLAIKHIAQQLGDCFPEAVCLARLGGDEFGVVLKTGSLAETEANFEQLRQRIMDVPPSEHNFSITVSIGVALSNVSGTSARELLKSADQSLYRAKEAGRNRISIQPINA